MSFYWLHLYTSLLLHLFINITWYIMKWIDQPVDSKTLKIFFLKKVKIVTEAFFSLQWVRAKDNKTVYKQPLIKNKISHLWGQRSGEMSLNLKLSFFQVHAYLMESSTWNHHHPCSWLLCWWLYNKYSCNQLKSTHDHWELTMLVFLLNVFFFCLHLKISLKCICNVLW